MAPQARGAAAQNLHACTPFPHSHLFLAPGAAHANSKLLHGGGLVHPEGNTQSRKLLWAGFIWGRKEGGKQNKDSPRGELALGQAVYGSASARCACIRCRYGWAPCKFAAGSVSFSEGSLKKC